MNTPSLHNHALFKSAENYELYRSLHFGTRGNAGSEYLMIDKRTGRSFSFDAQKEVKRFLDQAGEVVEWKSEDDWREILGK